MRHFFLGISILLTGFFNECAFGQESDTVTISTPLQEVVVRAFEQNRKLKNIPAAVNYVSRELLERFSPASIVQAVNATPGVRMEERSPGSYRFNIRGSSLRSPFGVRNIKVYFNDIPMTDPGGHTYLNQLGYYNFNSIEIIKGPGSSLYGAGTGGVLLIDGITATEQPNAFAEYAAGSYRLQNSYVSFTSGTQRTISKIGYQHQQSAGYRNHSELKRDVVSWNGVFPFGDNRSLKTTFLYGKLFYETPGALTLAEYIANPGSSRPGGFGFPGAEESKASIQQQSFIAGASYQQQFSPKWVNKSVVYGMFTELRNPTIRNYGKSSEPHVGGRSIFMFTQPFLQSTFRVTVGGEWQQGYTSVSIHQNSSGSPDSLESYDEINNKNQFVFTQASLETKGWVLTGGASYNLLKVRFQRFMPQTLGIQQGSFSNQLAPRVSLAKVLHQVTLYSSISRGFSPPTTAELLPSGGAINLGLQPEVGTNYDIGLKASFPGRVYADVNAFYFKLKNTIVQRRDAGGGDYFINAGKTRQRGVEVYMNYTLLQNNVIMKRSLLWMSYAWHDFRYKDFKQLAADYSGNHLPAEAPHTLAAGVDFFSNRGLQGTLSYYYSAKMPLNDANTVYADAYHLVGARMGYEKTIHQWRLKLIAGIENLLDQTYSLGNDINGFGGRYYNAAPGRNYYTSLVLQWNYKKVNS